MTHDDIRNGTTTLFAALNVMDGTVIGRNMQRHRHQAALNLLRPLLDVGHAAEFAAPFGPLPGPTPR